MHHIISDGWSTGVLFRELNALYAALANNRPSPLPELPIQYADYAVWQRQWLQGEVLEQQLAYWRQQLAGVPVLELPTDRPRPTVKTSQGARQYFVLPENLGQALRALSQREGGTLFMTLLAAFQALLCRYTGQKDIVVGTPMAGRTRAETEPLIGFFLNTLVLRTDLSGNPSFRELLRQVREVCLGAYAHQDIPFEKLVEELQPRRDLSRTPLFQVMFTLQEAAGAGPDQNRGAAPLVMNPLKVERATAKFDLMLTVRDRGKALTGMVEYSTDLFEAASIERMWGHFQTLLEGLVADPNRRLSELPLLTDTEQQQLLVQWNETGTDYPRHACIHHLVEAQARKTPEAVAAVFEDAHLSYRELNRRAHELAGHLRELGVGPEGRVGLCLERSLDMLVGLLGILKAGGAYVPLDPAYPNERLAFMLEDSQAPVLLTQTHLLDQLPEHQAQVVCLDQWAIRHPPSAICNRHGDGRLRQRRHRGSAERGWREGHTLPP
jgi:aspartate racemase